jgi:hypothetical protein
MDTLNADADGNITEAEWMTYMLEQHAVREKESTGKGSQWMEHILDTLQHGCKRLDSIRDQVIPPPRIRHALSWG